MNTDERIKKGLDSIKELGKGFESVSGAAKIASESMGETVLRLIEQVKVNGDKRVARLKEMDIVKDVQRNLVGRITSVTHRGIVIAYADCPKSTFRSMYTKVTARESLIKIGRVKKLKMRV